MFRSTLLVSLLLSAGFAAAQTLAPKDVDLVAPDGTKLRATSFAAAKPGPGVLLMHMCNTVRKSWEPVAKGLSEAGINALTIDNRGFGESGGSSIRGSISGDLEAIERQVAGRFRRGVSIPVGAAWSRQGAHRSWRRELRGEQRTKAGGASSLRCEGIGFAVGWA